MSDIVLRDPEPTTFERMRTAAARRAIAIEGTQQARLIAGFITKPDEEQLIERDDFEGLVRLLDKIIASREIMDLLKK